MSQLLKLRIRNRYFKISMVFLMLMLLFSWLFAGEIIPLFWYYDEDCGCSYWEFISISLDQMLCWESCIESSTRYVCIIFPVFSCIPILQLAEECSTYFSNGSTRFPSRRKALLKGITVYTLLGGLAIVLPMLLFITLVNYLMYPTIDSIGGLVSIFPDGFYRMHPYLTFFFMITVFYFLLSMAFALMGCSIALLTEKKILVIVLPFLFYMLETMVGRKLNGNPLFAALDVTTSFNTLRTTGELFIPILFLFFVDCILLVISFQKFNHKQIIC